MRAGLLNRQIKILQQSITRNEYGEQETINSGVINERARVVNLSSKKTSVNNETFWTDVKQLTIWSYVPVTYIDLIEIGGKEYRIVSIIEHPEDFTKTLNIELINK